MFDAVVLEDGSMTSWSVAVVRDDVYVGVEAVDDLERVRERVLVELLACAPTALIRVPSTSKVMSVLPGACVE